jgi:uncharacterized membrane protein
MLKFLKTTVIGGIVFMVPIVIFAMIIAKAIELTNKLAVPLSAMLPIDSIGNVAVVDLLALIIILLICFIAGLAAKSTLARKSIATLESRVLSKFPAYDFLKSKMHAVLQAEEVEGLKPVLVRFDDSWQIALEVEHIPGGTAAVYLPGAPDPWSGSVCFVTEDRIQSIELPLTHVLRTLKGLGKGSNEQLREYLKKVQ